MIATVSKASPAQDQDVLDKLRVLFEIAGELHSADRRDLRRAPRMESNAGVRIYGHRDEDGTFYATGRAVNVSETGALLLVQSGLSCGDQIMLLNQSNSLEQLATVVRFAGKRDGLDQIGVVFSEPNGAFWRGSVRAPEFTPRNISRDSVTKVGAPKPKWNRQGHR